MFVLSLIFFFFPFFFSFFIHIFWFFFSPFFFFFFIISHWFGMYIFFLSVFKLFFSLSGQLLIICLLHFSIAYEYPSFLSSFFFALKYPGFSFVNHPNLYSFSQENFPLKTIKNPSPRFFRYTRSRQNSAHILIISKPLFPNIFPNKNLIAPLQGGIHKISVCLVRHTKKYLSPSCSAPLARLFEIILVDRTTKSLRCHPRPQIVDINNFHKNPAWFHHRPKSIIASSQISKPVPKVLTTDMHNLWRIPSMSEFSKLSDQNPNLQ